LFSGMSECVCVSVFASAAATACTPETQIPALSTVPLRRTRVPDADTAVCRAATCRQQPVPVRAPRQGLDRGLVLVVPRSGRAARGVTRTSVRVSLQNKRKKNEKNEKNEKKKKKAHRKKDTTKTRGGRALKTCTPAPRGTPRCRSRPTPGARRSPST
jgi:hypothetical protein